jgi:ferritin-like metal-binding protein YciE
VSDIATPRDLFLHELGDILYVEEKLEQEVIPSLIDEVTDAEFKQGLERHLQQTRQHVENVEEVFSKLAEEPTAEKCIGFEGLKEEHDELVSEASSEITDLVDAGAVARTEHYEIAAYEGLISMARALDEKDVIELLETNLKDEKETLREVESIAKRVGKETVKA